MQSNRALVVAQEITARTLELRDAREKTTPGWKRIHQAADANVPAVEAHVANAFAKAYATLGTLPEGEMAIEIRLSNVMVTFERHLRDGLEWLLLETLHDGGDAAAKTLMASPLMRTSQGYYKPTLVLLKRALAKRGD